MTDRELAEYLCIIDDPRWPQVIAKLDPKKRATYERLYQICREIELYEAGLGPRPQNIILCYDYKHKQEKT